MNTIQKGIITLIKSAITGEKLPLPEGFHIDEAKAWIGKHSLQAICYQGAYLCGIPSDEPGMKDLFQAYYKSLIFSERQMAEVNRVLSAFAENGIDHMPLKGVNMKPLYPKPELRSMGDADILIRVKQYDLIVPVMEKLGFVDTEETDHELVWKSPALYLELHKRIIPSYNWDFYEYYGDGWDLAMVQEGTRYRMSPEDEWIFLFTHFAKHYRDGGIGCRHVTDLWVWLRTHPDMDTAYIERALIKLRLAEFYENMMHLIRMWFSDGPSDEKSEVITDFVFSSGNWGAMESRAISQGLRNVKITRGVWTAKVKYVLNILFPGVEMLRHKYKILQKMPWMLPAVWIVRPFYKLIAEKKSVIQHQQNIKTMSSGNIESRKEALLYVGLDYHF